MSVNDVAANFWHVGFDGKGLHAGLEQPDSVFDREQQMAAMLVWMQQRVEEFVIEGSILGAWTFNGGDHGINRGLPALGNDTLLHIAAREGQPEMLEFLLKKGADAMLANDKGERAIDVARSADCRAALAAHFIAIETAQLASTAAGAQARHIKRARL